MSRCTRGLFVWILTLAFTGALCKSLDGADKVWRDWLLVEENAPSDPAPGTLLRRITPKSVFVAPSFNSGCKEGQQVDSDGRCVQIVKVDQAAHLDFLLKRFNSMFAPQPSKKVEKDSPGPFHVSLPLGGVDRPETATTTKSHPPVSTSPPPLLTTSTEKTTKKTETTPSPTTTVTMPPSTSFPTAIDHDPTTELLNFSDESTTPRVPHETMKPSTFFTRLPPTSNPTYIYSPTTFQIDQLHTGSTRTDSSSLPSTFNTQSTDALFGVEDLHRTRPSSPHTTVTAPATIHTDEPLEDFHKTRPPSSQTLFTAPPTLQTIEPFEGLHRTRPSSLYTTFPAPPTVDPDETFALKGFQRTRPSSLQHSSTTSATTTLHLSSDSLQGQDKDSDTHMGHEFQNQHETLVYSGNTDYKRPFVIVVANNTFTQQQPTAGTEETSVSSDYDSTTESTPVESSIPESTTTSFGHTSDYESLNNNEGLSTTESVVDSTFESEKLYFSSVLTPRPTVNEYSLERFPALEGPPSFDGSKDSLDGAPSFQQMNAPENTRSKCDSSYEVSQLRDGRIISQSSITNCQPVTTTVKTTTTRTRTVAPASQGTSFRFPLESQTANRPSYVRFPELPSASNHNTQLWVNENGDDHRNQQSPYYWPLQSSWNPYPSSMIRGWPLVDRSHVSSNVYRKQYYQHPVPQWMSKTSHQYAWPIRRT